MPSRSSSPVDIMTNWNGACEYTLNPCTNRLMPANAGTRGSDKDPTLKDPGPPIDITAAGSTFSWQLLKDGPSDSGSGPSGDVVLDNPTSSSGSEPNPRVLVTTVTESPSHGRF